MYRSLKAIALGGVSLALLLTGSGVYTSHAAAHDVGAGPDQGNPAAAYCVQSGGVVQLRYPTYGTNGSASSWLRLAGPRQFCEFTATDGSQISILLETLYTTQPTLAALAYYNEPPENPPGPGNPASYYCSQLGGSDQFGGQTAAGGGWVLKGSTSDVLEACIFPDMSSIDSWVLTYNTNGIIRGIDLTKVMRYHPPTR